MAGTVQIDALKAGLVARQAADGGWAYYAGKASRLEPTCWALLALGSTGAAGDRALTFLRSLARDDGLLWDPGSPEVNFAWNGLTLLAIRARPADDALRDRIVDALVGVKGVQLPARPGEAPVIPHDGLLQAWPWTTETFSWVEPTACCLLALKQAARRTPAVAARLDEAEALLVDRVCPGGGWNYGNAAVLGQDLRAYVPTTALALLALQDRPAEVSVSTSLDWLVAHGGSEPSAMALSLSAIALTVFGRPVRPLLDGLASMYGVTGYLENAHLMAMALYALTLDDHAARHLRVAPREDVP